MEKIKIKLPSLKCTRCKHTWYPRRSCLPRVWNCESIYIEQEHMQHRAKQEQFHAQLIGLRHVLFYHSLEKQIHCAY